jgi:hypothetical protein
MTPLPVRVSPMSSDRAFWSDHPFRYLNPQANYHSRAQLDRFKLTLQKTDVMVLWKSITGVLYHSPFHIPMAEKMCFVKNMVFAACLPQHCQHPTRSNRSSGLIRNSYLLNKQMIIDNS